MADLIKCPECGHAGHRHFDATGCDEKECFCIRTLGGIALEQLVELRAAVEAAAQHITFRQHEQWEIRATVKGDIREHPADALVRWYY